MQKNRLGNFPTRFIIEPKIVHKKRKRILSLGLQKR